MLDADPNSDEPLEVDMSGSKGEPEGVAVLLESASKLMRKMPEERRYDVDLSITEVEDDDA